MVQENCLKLPVNFAHREEVRRFVLALRAISVADHLALHAATMLMFEFAGQQRDFRKLDGFAIMLGEYLGWRDMTGLGAGVLFDALLGSGLLVPEERNGVVGVTCPLFNESNPHLLPGFESMQSKGARIAAAKRMAAQDRDTADAHLRMFERQSLLNLGHLDADISKDEVTAALCFIMRIDRAGGLATRPSTGYEIWMIAAASRFLRSVVPADVEKLCEFLLEARIDPKVPKGAELVLPMVEQLLTRARA